MNHHRHHIIKCRIRWQDFSHLFAVYDIQTHQKTQKHLFFRLYLKPLNIIKHLLLNLLESCLLINYNIEIKAVQ